MLQDKYYIITDEKEKKFPYKFIELKPCQVYIAEIGILNSFDEAEDCDNTTISKLINIHCNLSSFFQSHIKYKTYYYPVKDILMDQLMYSVCLYQDQLLMVAMWYLLILLMEKVNLLI